MAHFFARELLVFAGTAPPLPGGVFGVFPSLVWYALFMASLAARFPAMLRHLRVLPLSARQVNTLLVAWPAVIWLTVWTGLAALHYVVVGRGVSSWHVAFFVALAGSSALVQALTLRLVGVLRLFWFITAGGGRPAPRPGQRPGS